MPIFQLFRIKLVQQSDQLRLSFQDPQSKPSVLRAAIDSRPSGQIRRGVLWRVGNVHPLDRSAVYFAFGRTTPAELEVFDERTGSFEVAPFESSTSTHAIVDFENQTCALAKKATLAKDAVQLARRLARVLSSAPVVRDNESSVEIEAIPDQDDFVAILSRAHQISKFTLKFSLPNPWDAEKQIQRPLESTLAELRGTKGSTTFTGEDLDGDRLAALARATAATANDASAVVRMGRNSKPVTRHLREKSITMSIDDFEREVSPMLPLGIRVARNIRDWMDEQYQRVRGNVSQ
jgi:hypothetical protein